MGNFCVGGPSSWLPAGCWNKRNAPVSIIRLISSMRKGPIAFHTMLFQLIPPLPSNLSQSPSAPMLCFCFTAPELVRPNRGKQFDQVSLSLSVLSCKPLPVVCHSCALGPIGSPKEPKEQVIRRRIGVGQNCSTKAGLIIRRALQELPFPAFHINDIWTVPLSSGTWKGQPKALAHIGLCSGVVRVQIECQKVPFALPANETPSS